MNKPLSKNERLKDIFRAQKLAVVGVSSNPEKDGYTTLKTIVDAGYKGNLYPVNPRGGEICGVKVYKSVDEIPDTLDAAVIIVRADIVSQIMDQTAAKGAKGAIILSGGFKESGRADLEEVILKTAQKHGMLIMGPNIQGINYPPNNLCAMMFPVIKKKGPLCIVSQSGSVTAALSEWAEQEGYGISAAVNLGNKTGLDESDYLDFFAEDKNTGVIALYLEDIKDGRRFMEALDRAVREKPVAILKAGRTQAGMRAAASHTGAMAGNHEVFASFCRQHGAFCAQNLTQLYDAAKGMGGLKPPKGRRVLIISTSGGICTLSTDEAEMNGLTIPALTPELKADLLGLDLFSPLAQLKNPMDLVEVASGHFLEAARLAGHHDAADILLLAFGDPTPGGVEVICTLEKELNASLAVSYTGGGEEEQKARLRLQEEAGFPVFSTPERALTGIAAAVFRAEYLKSRELFKKGA